MGGTSGKGAWGGRAWRSRKRGGERRRGGRGGMGGVTGGGFGAGAGGTRSQLAKGFAGGGVIARVQRVQQMRAARVTREEKSKGATQISAVKAGARSGRTLPSAGPEMIKQRQQASKFISQEIRAGYPRAQAIAIGLRRAGVPPKTPKAPQVPRAYAAGGEAKKAPEPSRAEKDRQLIAALQQHLAKTPQAAHPAMTREEMEKTFPVTMFEGVRTGGRIKSLQSGGRIYRILTEDINRPKIEKIVGKKYPGFTVVPSTGYWKGQREKSIAIELVGAKKRDVVQIATQIKKANKQQAMLVEGVAATTQFLRKGGKVKSMALGGVPKQMVLPFRDLSNRRLARQQTIDFLKGAQGTPGYSALQAKGLQFRAKVGNKIGYLNRAERIAATQTPKVKPLVSAEGLWAKYMTGFNKTPYARGVQTGTTSATPLYPPRGLTKAGKAQLAPREIQHQYHWGPDSGLLWKAGKFMKNRRAGQMYTPQTRLPFSQTKALRLPVKARMLKEIPSGRLATPAEFQSMTKATQKRYVRYLTSIDRRHNVMESLYQTKSRSGELFPQGAKVTIGGLTFKPDRRDFRRSYEQQMSALTAAYPYQKPLPRGQVRSLARQALSKEAAARGVMNVTRMGALGLPKPTKGVAAGTLKQSLMAGGVPARIRYMQSPLTKDHRVGMDKFNLPGTTRQVTWRNAMVRKYGQKTEPPYQPNPTDLSWSRNVHRMMTEGGVWGYPAAGMIYRKQGNKLILANRERLADRNAFVNHLRVQSSFGAAGVKVEPAFRHMTVAGKYFGVPERNAARILKASGTLALGSYAKGGKLARTAIRGISAGVGAHLGYDIASTLTGLKGGVSRGNFLAAAALGTGLGAAAGYGISRYATRKRPANSFAGGGAIATNRLKRAGWGALSGLGGPFAGFPMYYWGGATKKQAIRTSVGGLLAGPLGGAIGASFAKGGQLRQPAIKRERGVTVLLHPNETLLSRRAASAITAAKLGAATVGGAALGALLLRRNRMAGIAGGALIGSGLGGAYAMRPGGTMALVPKQAGRRIQNLPVGTGLLARTPITTKNPYGQLYRVQGGEYVANAKWTRRLNKWTGGKFNPDAAKSPRIPAIEIMANGERRVSFAGGGQVNNPARMARIVASRGFGIASNVAYHVGTAAGLVGGTLAGGYAGMKLAQRYKWTGNKGYMSLLTGALAGGGLGAQYGGALASAPFAMAYRKAMPSFRRGGIVLKGNSAQARVNRATVAGAAAGFLIPDAFTPAGELLGAAAGHRIGERITGKRVPFIGRQAVTAVKKAVGGWVSRNKGRIGTAAAYGAATLALAPVVEKTFGRGYRFQFNPGIRRVMTGRVMTMAALNTAVGAATYRKGYGVRNFTPMISAAGYGLGRVAGDAGYGRIFKTKEGDIPLISPYNARTFAFHAAYAMPVMAGLNRILTDKKLSKGRLGAMARGGVVGAGMAGISSAANFPDQPLGFNRKTAIDLALLGGGMAVGAAKYKKGGGIFRNTRYVSNGIFGGNSAVGALAKGVGMGVAVDAAYGLRNLPDIRAWRKSVPIGRGRVAWQSTWDQQGRAMTLAAGGAVLGGSLLAGGYIARRRERKGQSLAQGGNVRGGESVGRKVGRFLWNQRGRIATAAAYGAAGALSVAMDRGVFGRRSTYGLRMPSVTKNPMFLERMANSFVGYGLGNAALGAAFYRKGQGLRNVSSIGTALGYGLARGYGKAYADVWGRHREVPFAPASAWSLRRAGFHTLYALPMTTILSGVQRAGMAKGRGRLAAAGRGAVLGGAIATAMAGSVYEPHGTMWPYKINTGLGLMAGGALAGAAMYRRGARRQPFSFIGRDVVGGRNPLTGLAKGLGIGIAEQAIYSAKYLPKLARPSGMRSRMPGRPIEYNAQLAMAGTLLGGSLLVGARANRREARVRGRYERLGMIARLRGKITPQGRSLRVRGEYQRPGVVARLRANFAKGGRIRPAVGRAIFTGVHAGLGALGAAALTRGRGLSLGVRAATIGAGAIGGGVVGRISHGVLGKVGPLRFGAGLAGSLIGGYTGLRLAAGARPIGRLAAGAVGWYTGLRTGEMAAQSGFAARVHIPRIQVGPVGVGPTRLRATAVERGHTDILRSAATTFLTSPLGHVRLFGAEKAKVTPSRIRVRVAGKAAAVTPIGEATVRGGKRVTLTPRTVQAEKGAKRNTFLGNNNTNAQALRVGGRVTVNNQRIKMWGRIVAADYSQRQRRRGAFLGQIAGAGLGWAVGGVRGGVRGFAIGGGLGAAAGEAGALRWRKDISGVRKIGRIAGYGALAGGWRYAVAGGTYAGIKYGQRRATKFYTKKVVRPMGNATIIALDQMDREAKVLRRKVRDLHVEGIAQSKELRRLMRRMRKIKKIRF